MEKKILFISFYGRVCISTRILSAICKKRGHDSHILYVKEDRSIPVEYPDQDSGQFQFLRPDTGAKFYGTGVDVSPITECELNIIQNKAQELLPDVIAVSSRSVHKELSQKVVNKIREVLPEKRFIAGGYGPSLEPERFLNFVDYVCIGKGDQAIIDLIERDDPSDCPHIASKQNGKIKTIPPDDSFDINERPYLDWVSENMYMVEDDQLYSLIDKFDTQNYVTLASEGCISTCTYCQACQWPQIYKLHGGNTKKVLMRSPENVIEELISAKNKFNITTISLQDSIFTWNKKWFEKFIYLYKQKVDLPFNCFVDSRFTNKDQIEQLIECGLFSCSIGIQSADEYIRRNIMGRNESNEHLLSFAELINCFNIKFTYDIILWNPFETTHSLKNGVSLLNKLPKTNRIFIYQLKMFPKSEIKAIYENSNPKSLSNKEFMFWSMIYVMLLRSDETNQFANQILSHNMNLEIDELQDEYNKLMSSIENSEKLVSIREIDKGEVLRPTMFIEKKCNNVSAVKGEKRHEITGKIARKFIPKNTFLTYEDFYSSYINRNSL